MDENFFKITKELFEKEKEATLCNPEYNFMQHALDEEVECIHCGKRFLFKEARVFKTDDIFMDTVILCKYPDCDGTLIDFIPTHEIDNKKKK